MSFVDITSMNDFGSMSHSDHEDISASFLVKFRDIYEKRIQQGEISGTDKAGDKSDMIENLLAAYFDYRRELIPIPVPSKELTYQQLVDFINNEVLLFLSDEKPELFEYDKKTGRYFMLFNDDDD